MVKKIPLQRFREFEFPYTAPSTVHHWAVEGFYHNRGPLSGRVERLGGRWYVAVSIDTLQPDPVAADIIEKIHEESHNE